jgi:hypothetical protein
MTEQWEESVESLEAWFIDSDTDPEISNCITKALLSRRPGSFELLSLDLDEAHPARQAAADQDRIGWYHFVEGRISKKWALAQQAYYYQQHSQRTGESWASNLVDHLLALVHRQWIQRNAVVHERDANGLRIKEGVELETEIDQQFTLGVDGLHQQDHHFITRGRAKVNDMSGPAKKAWVSGITLARHAFEAATTADNSATGRMRRNLEEWLFRPTR